MKVLLILAAAVLWPHVAAATCKYGGVDYDDGSLTCQVGQTMQCADTAWKMTGQTCEDSVPRATISVIRASYDCESGGNWCEATSQIAGECNGKTQCSLTVDPWKTMCGDVCPGIKKNVKVNYECKLGTAKESRPWVTAADFAKLSLSCS